MICKMTRMRKNTIHNYKIIEFLKLKSRSTINPIWTFEKIEKIALNADSNQFYWHSRTKFKDVVVNLSTLLKKIDFIKSKIFLTLKNSTKS